MKVKKLQEVIGKSTFDAIILSGLENPKAANNLRYITNYSGTYGFAIIGEKYKYFLSDFRYRDQVKLEVPDFTFVEITEGLMATIEKIVEKEAIVELGFDQKIRFSEYQMLDKLECDLTPMDNVIENLRLLKTKEEIKKLKKACEITDQALTDILKVLKVGMVEKDVEVLLKNKMIELGADNTWDRFIVASGPRGAMPHGSASDKVIQEGELVTFDIGCSFEGYTSDLTRTVAMGNVSDKLKEIYNVVYEAQVAGVKAAKASITGVELDAVCRNYITEKGYGEYFKHGTGHGIGLDVHEGPTVNSKYNKELGEGAVITIEPGIYISGLGGVRIEDDVVLTKDGCIVLNEFPKELITIK